MGEKNRLETPLWGELDGVYEPSEDSFLLIDALEEDLHDIRRVGPRVVLEVGSGSGVVVTALSRALGSTAHCIAIDINPKASAATSHTASINKATVDAVTGDLVSCMKTGLIDLLIFNPPYVVTPPEEIDGDLPRAWAGGLKGRQVTDRLVKELPRIMSSDCIGYMVAIDENCPHEISIMMEEDGFSVRTVARRRVPGENLSVLRFSRTKLSTTVIH